jgi:hypothetical protein
MSHSLPPQSRRCSSGDIGPRQAGFATFVMKEGAKSPLLRGGAVAPLGAAGRSVTDRVQFKTSPLASFLGSPPLLEGGDFWTRNTCYDLRQEVREMNRRAFIVTSSIGLVGAVCRDAHAAAISPGLLEVQPRKAAPSFSLPNMDRQVVRSSDFAGSVLILRFWATW